jgi:hypothetical protein
LQTCNAVQPRFCHAPNARCLRLIPRRRCCTTALLGHQPRNANTAQSHAVARRRFILLLVQWGLAQQARPGTGHPGRAWQSVHTDMSLLPEPRSAQRAREQEGAARQYASSLQHYVCKACAQLRTVYVAHAVACGCLTRGVRAVQLHILLRVGPRKLALAPQSTSHRAPCGEGACYPLWPGQAATWARGERARSALPARARLLGRNNHHLQWCVRVPPRDARWKATGDERFQRGSLAIWRHRACRSLPFEC